jgi:hypothetical protein
MAKRWITEAHPRSWRFLLLGPSVITALLGYNIVDRLTSGVFLPDILFASPEHLIWQEGDCPPGQKVLLEIPSSCVPRTRREALFLREKGHKVEFPADLLYIQVDRIIV